MTTPFPSYQDQFGSVDFKSGEAARSVYSPAAYLADLMQLLDDYFGNPELSMRRPDIEKLPLDAAHTYSLLPYLDIVNKLLLQKTPSKSKSGLRDVKYPLNLPYNDENERIKERFRFLDVERGGVHRLFDYQPQKLKQARLALGLSEEMLQAIIDEDDTGNANAFVGSLKLKDNQQITQVDVFTAATGSMFEELLELLNPVLNFHDIEVRSMMFATVGLKGYMELAEGDTQLRWVSDDDSDGEADAMIWLGRVLRLIRLHQQCAVNLPNLFLILRNCCQNRLNAAAIQTIGVIRQIAEAYDLEIPKVVSLLGLMDSLWRQDNPPDDLFNRVYNVSFTDIDQYFLTASFGIPESYQDNNYQPLSLEGDIFASRNDVIRKRVLHALHMRADDLRLLIERFKDQAPRQRLEGGEEDVSALQRLSLYYRVSMLCNMTEMSIAELLDLLDLLQLDPLIGGYHGFDTLIGQKVDTLPNVYHVLDSGSTDQRLWLVQLLLALSQWMQRAGFTAAELMAIMSGESESKAAAAKAEQQLIEGFNSLYQQFLQQAFSAEYLQIDGFDERSAQVLFSVLSDAEQGVVSKQDARLLRTGNSQFIIAALYAGLHQLAEVNTGDFHNLGLEQKMRDAIFSRLLLKGILQPDGMLVDRSIVEDMPLELAANINDQAVFALIRQRLLEQQQSGASTEDSELFLTDLAELNLTDADSKILYESLIVNGHLDEQGSVLRADFFTDNSNLDAFSASTAIAEHGESIKSFIQQKITAFDAAKCTISAELFASLPLNDIETLDLLENLRFNDYLDESGHVVDKQALLELTLPDFELALQYYPHRKPILGLLQQQLRELKAKHYRFSSDDFKALAREMVAEQIHTAVQQHYLQDGWFHASALAFFADDSNAEAFALGDYFDANSRIIVFKAIKRMIDGAQAYQLMAQDFDELGLAEEDNQQILQLLVDAERLQPDGSLTAEQVQYFLTINNALLLDLPDYADFNKDIFFVVHELAKRIDETIKELSPVLQDLAQIQQDTLLAGLQEMLEIPADMISVISSHIFGADESISEHLMAPVLSAVNEDGLITQRPHSRVFSTGFNRMRQFARLASKLDMNGVEADVAFRDQSLVAKFPEQLSLPQGIARIDCLLQVSVDGNRFKRLSSDENQHVLLLYNSDSQRYWLYSKDNYEKLDDSDDLSLLSPLLAAADGMDAAFNDTDGNAWIVVGAQFFKQAADEVEWHEEDKELGKIANNFAESARIDSAFVDQDDKLYLFSGDQYIRSSDALQSVDEGYPRKIAANWPQEHGLALPQGYDSALDAAFHDRDGNTWFFKDQHFISTENLSEEKLISEFWGKVKNNFANAEKPLQKIDAAFVLAHKVYFFSGEQCLSWSFSLENPDGFADEGSLQSLDDLIPGLPHIFAHGIDAIFRGVDDSIHVFKDGHSLKCDLNFNILTEEEKLSGKWGRVSNRIVSTGKVSAAFTGLDGKSYLFSGTQFFRYSGNNYAWVDEGYPKTIAAHWGGLKTVDAAFILDGKTYLIGNGSSSWVRYSDNDYSLHDQDFPQPLERQWWSEYFNLEPNAGGHAFEPDSDEERIDFTTPDTVFIGNDGITYLFKGKHYIAYDKLHRWWSEPDEISNKWAEYDYDLVDAAFTGKDGCTYLFCGTKHLRYSDKSFNRLDDRYPKTTRSTWGQVDNTIQKLNRIDAALVVDTATYLFSGDQYVRYSDGEYDMVDEGYPKSVAMLNVEPRFENLNAALQNGIDAAFADRRSIYLCSGADCAVISSGTWKRYELEQPVSAVVRDEGKLYIENAEGWHLLVGLEGNSSVIPVSQSPLLARIHEGIHGVSAAFIGVDDTAYVFKDGQCYNDLLEKSYPIGEEWGRGRNEIAETSHIDAALSGVDGKTYVFSGDQYCVYDLSNVVSADPGYVAMHDGSIAEDWGGLQNVHVAFIREGKTYLLEAPQENGLFRYVCYSGEDYSQADCDQPETADIGWWNFPSVYVEEGFDQVDAVLFEDEHMYLFKDDEFIQYNSEEELWSYPRPVSRIWRNLPFDAQTDTAIAAAFTDEQGRHWFFSDSYFSMSDAGGFSAPQKIGNHWGKVENILVESNRVDAVLVLDSVTYLFAGAQYVRYSSADYRNVDQGYPKSIIGELREESAFGNLPDSFDEYMTALLAEDPQAGINGIAADERTITIFVGKHYHALSRSNVGQFGVERVGRIRNHLQTSGRVDAAFVNSNRQTLLFSGDQYVRYSGQDYNEVDAGYPKSILADFASENGGVAITQGFGIDAIVQHGSGDGQDTFVFKDNDVFSTRDDTAMPLKALLPLPENTFNQGIDAGFVDARGRAYFFNGGSYIRYASLDNEFMDEGFPKIIRDHWGNLPQDFETRIDHAFMFEGKTYLVRGEQYVRYFGSDYQLVDALSPQAFSYRWGDWLDYALSDIHLISQFKTLLENNLRGDYSLRDLLNLQTGYKKEPYKMLSTIFGWDMQQVKWLKRKNAFISQAMRTDREIYFNIELVLKMHAIFGLADKIGTTPEALYNDIYLSDNAGELEAVDKQLSHSLRLLNSDKDWETLGRELHDTMNQRLQDTLLPYVIHLEDDVDNARDLFAQLLIDVNMGAEARTSEIKEAISAIQLYVHRYFVNLEQSDLKNTERDALKDWWKWMRNYRVWEANRKVFLYPENYIRPELRDTKSPAFKKLEEALLQGEVTQDLVGTAFNNYLNEFAQVGNLKITGANVYEDPRYPDDDSLVLFGHTRTEPAQYHYRTARFTATDTVLWGNWLPVETSINSTRVFPVFAFGRILVFWTEIESFEEHKPFILTDSKQTSNSSSKVDTSDTITKYRADIKYSFYDFNRQWINPQTLVRGIELEYSLDAAYAEGESIVTFVGEFCLTTSRQNPQGVLKRISEIYENMPFTSNIDAAVLFEGKRIFFKGGQCVSQNEHASSSWTEVKPIGDVFKAVEKTESSTHVLINDVLGIVPDFGAHYSRTVKKGAKAYQQGVGAAFTVDGKVCLIDKFGQPTFFLNDDVENGSGFTEETYTETQVDTLNVGLFQIAIINIITRDLLRMEPIDAIFEYEDEAYQYKLIYVLRNGQYECYQYTGDEFEPLEKLDGYPKPIRDNLGFDMDQFYNRLHLAADQLTQDEDIIKLTYFNPKVNNSPLLLGKINDDLTFTETDIRNNIDKQALINSGEIVKNLLDGATRVPPELPASTLGFLKAVDERIQELQNEANAEWPGIMSSVLKQYDEAIGLLLEIKKAQSDEIEAASNGDNEATVQRVSISEPDRKKVQELLGHLSGDSTGVIALLQSIEAGGERSLLLESAKSLVTAFSTFADLATEDWHTAFDDLQKELVATQERFDDEMELAEFKLRVLKAEITPSEIDEYRNRSAGLLQAIHRQLDTFTNLNGQLESPALQGIIVPDSPDLSDFQNAINETNAVSWVEQLSASTSQTSIKDYQNGLQEASEELAGYADTLNSLQRNAAAISKEISEFPQELEENINQKIEAAFGVFDVFPADFDIQNQTNFTFGQPDWHIFEAKLGTFLCRPMDVSSNPRYEIIRLTTRTIPKLSRALFSGGIKRLLTLDSQGIDEEPYFKPNTALESMHSVDDIDGVPTVDNTIYYNPAIIKKVPESGHLDYRGANKNYYWEIFFHAPFLIAQALNEAQKFEEAKSWYEYIFDPTSTSAIWEFLPFKQSSDLRQQLTGQLTSPLPVEDLKSEIEIYLNDPFDPHAIANIRKIAYQKAIVMRYVDNLLDWGDLLFRQYSIESINEARMLYVLAYDLLGDKPHTMGNKDLPKTRSYAELTNPSGGETDLLLGSGQSTGETTEITISEGTPHATVQNAYFHIPENDLFLDYWNRVEDRLYKIRNSLNIDGVKQALPLFQPPIDPMSIVQAVAGGGSLSQIVAGSGVAVPHYRFGFMLGKARELTQKLSQFSGELLSAIEKQDSEELSLLQNKQQGVIQKMMTQVKEAQIEEARHSIAGLEASLEMVKANQQYNISTVDSDFLPGEIAQMSLMSSALVGHGIAVTFHALSVIGAAYPNAKLGPFIIGFDTGGEQVKSIFDSIAETAASASEGLSIGGELAGMIAQHHRMMADTRHQAESSVHDIAQINAQIEGATQQLKIAEYELAIHEKEIEQHQSITTFMTGKFSNAQLYRWMSSKLSGLYYQSYKMAWDMAKAAEQAFRYERGARASDVSFINGNYWNSQRKGLLAGESLDMDLDRMEKAFIESDARRLEITKSISLLELDPLAFLLLKADGECEFEFSEALFDYDFQGHYCRQIKTIAIEFDAPEGVTVNATLTQLNHKTVMEPDAKAIKYLMEPKDSQPPSIRSDWRASQQIVLSHVDEYEKPHGLFELRYDDDRYLPFEGTGAVSRWHLQLNGKRGAVNLDELRDATITIKYTALQGGEAFGDAVRGLLKPYPATHFLDFNTNFNEQWQDFLIDDERSLTLNLRREHFPNMAGGRITDIFSVFELDDEGEVSLIMNNDDSLLLRDQQFMNTTGLSVSSNGSAWTFTVQGNKAILKNVQLVVGYKGKP